MVGRKKKMREKSDNSKHIEGRGVISEKMYVAWKLARETKSIGLASTTYDPIVGRAVNTLSRQETKVFWVLRYNPSVLEIFEQFPLAKAEVTAICHELGVKAYCKVLSTDFLVKMKNGWVAVSVKQNRNLFNKTKNPEGYDDLVIRQAVEKIYWERNYGIPFKILFGDEVSDVLANNIKNIMHFWDARFITNKVSKLKFLLAHGVIDVPMNEDYIRFGVLAEQYDVETMYETYRDENRKNSRIKTPGHNQD